MLRIFSYELKRIIFNRMFFALLIITGIYSYMILEREIILGIAFTAPFSPWSFAAYLANVLPLLMICLLFFLTLMYSDNERRIRHLTFAASIEPFKLYFIKCASIIAGFLIMTLFVITLGITFFAILFRFTYYISFIIPIVITIIPCMLFILGAGLLLGSIHLNTLYVLMIAALLLGFLPAFDFYGASFYSTHPVTLPLGPDGEPEFSLPALFILSRVFFSVAGILTGLLGIRRYKLQNLQC